MRDTILFDINETVVDLNWLRPRFAAAFGDQAVTPLWFAMLLHTSTVCAITNVATRFADLAGAALDNLAHRRGLKLDPEDREKILAGFASLPAHADIVPALSQLRAAGFRTIAFSNSSLALVTSQVANAGLNDHFDDILSVEETGSFKPDPKVYAFAAARTGRQPDELRLVATHDWDTHGALSAGLQAAYIDRSGAPYNPYYRRPDIVAGTMTAIAEKIIEAERS
jgi:2-haloacid dehalogenase